MGTVEKNFSQELVDRLKDGITNIYTNGAYQAYLDTMMRFPTYSARNCALIQMQCPEATQVAGMRKWETDFERKVRKGERAIRILAPAPYKELKEYVVQDESGDIVVGQDNHIKTEMREIERIGFKVAYVFDLSQTEGKELPEIIHPLKDTVEDYEKVKAAFEAAAPCKVVYGKIRGGANGLYSIRKKLIAIQEDMGQTQTLKTLIHEIAHAYLHDPEGGLMPGVDRRTKEVQAESIAYVTCGRLGLDTSDYSFGYIAGWSSGKEAKELVASSEVIKKQADSIYEKICQKLGLEAEIKAEPLKLKSDSFKAVM